MSERMKDERLAEIEKKLRKCGWSESIKGELTDNEALFVALKAERAKVAELETTTNTAWLNMLEAQRQRSELKAKVAELRKENDDLMTLAIPELQLDLKDALAKVAELEASCDALHNYISDKNIPELEARYKAASGLALSWGNYFNRAQLEQEIERIIQQEISDE